MAHVSSIGSGLFSTFIVSGDVVTPTQYETIIKESNQAKLKALFTKALVGSNLAAEAGAALKTSEAPSTSGKWNRIPNLRELPAVGTPPSLTNVPEYGSKISKQIQAQADPENVEITINNVPSAWVATTALGKMLADKKSHIFLFILANTEPTGYALETGELGTQENTIVAFLASMASKLDTPSLSDANQATLSLALRSDYSAPFTQAGSG